MERKPNTQDLKLLSKDPNSAYAFVTCLENLDPQHDLSKLQDPRAFQQKAALCTFGSFESAAFSEVNDPAALGPYVQKDLNEHLSLLRSVQLRPPYYWRAGEVQASFRNNISGEQVILSTPDIVKVAAVANGFSLNIVEVAGVHIFMSQNIYMPSPGDEDFLIRRVLRLLLKNQDGPVKRLQIPRRLKEGTYFCEHELPTGAGIGVSVCDKGFHVGIFNHRLYIVFPKLPESPTERPVVFRGIDPNAYISPMLKATVKDEVGAVSNSVR
jgi:hypothetical protein